MTFRSRGLLAAAFVAASIVPATADLKIVTHRSFGGRRSKVAEVEYIQGKRLRSEYQQAPDRYQTILQCDLRRMIELNLQTRLFAVTALGYDGLPVGRRHAQADPGPVVDYTITTEDTGERATIFGMPAWHVRETARKTSPQPFSILGTVTDYWFVDLKVPFGCHGWAEGADSLIAESPHFRIKRIGEARRGFPILRRTVIINPRGKNETVVEVTELSTEALDPRLFEIPEGFAPALRVGERVDLERPDTVTNRMKATWDGFWVTMAKFIY